MNVIIIVLLAVVALLVALVAVRQFSRGAGSGADLLQQQLLAMRTDLQRVSDVQRELQGLLPQQLAAGRAEAAETLSRQVAALSEAVTSQLAESRKSVGDRLDETSRTVADVRERLGKLGEVTERLEGVGRSVTEVQQLLQVPKLRGTLGELWLEEVLRQVLPAGGYQMQYRFPSGDVVDAVVWVGDQCVPVDSKFPLEACQRMLAAEGDAVGRERAAFRRSLKARVMEISTKYIRPEEGTLDFALMYVPAENVYYEAVVRGEVAEDEESFYAFTMKHRVIPVSPHTIYAYLTAVLFGLKGMRMEERGREMLEQLAGLGLSFSKFAASFDKVGTHLGNAQKQFDEAEKHSGRIRDQFDRISTGPTIPAEVATLPSPQPSNPTSI